MIFFFLFLFSFGQMPHRGPIVYKSKRGEEIFENNHWMIYHPSLVPEPHDLASDIRIWYSSGHHTSSRGTDRQWDLGCKFTCWISFFFPSLFHSYLKLYFVLSNYKTVGTLAINTKKIPGFFHSICPTAQSPKESLHSPALCMQAQCQHIPGGLGATLILDRQVWKTWI